jgi:phosphate transport system protein
LLALFDAEDKNTIEKLHHSILVDSSKSDDIYAIIEKDVLKMIQCDDVAIEDYFNLLKTIRKSQKIIDRAESIATLLVFSKLGGEIS